MHVSSIGPRIALIAVVAAAPLLSAQNPAVGSVARRTAGYEYHDGFLPFQFNRKDGKLFLEVAETGEEFLYVVGLASGANWPVERGANPERPPMVVRFEKQGQRLLLVARDLRYRASGPDSVALNRLTADVFPPAVLWSFAIATEADGRSVVDATDFLLRDAYGTLALLRQLPETGFRLDRERSSIAPDRSNAFPRNTEIETTLTFVADQPSGSWSTTMSQDPRVVSVRQHHSFVALPSPGYRPRAADPRLGLTTLTIRDLSARFDENDGRQWITRFRLEKKDPSAARSEPVHPITFFLEAGIPSLYRQAVRDGILYWNRVFEAAGFKNAIRVEDLPAGSDPLDMRYQVVVLWSPGTARRTSVAVPISDPRTGELLKAFVYLDSYRSLDDYNRYAAMAPALAAGQPDATSYVMTRRRWLIAHESAHVLAGLWHYTLNPSQVGFRLPTARPTPDKRLTLDLSTGDVREPLAYDELMIRYAYSEFPASQERKALETLIDGAVRRGLSFVSDDIRANPRAVSRLGGSDVLTELARESEVRRIMLAHFGANVLRPGDPMSMLFDRLVPAYFEHRLALSAAAKAIGGVEYLYASRGDSASPVHVVPPAYQRAALAALLRALEPDELEIPERIAALIPPRSVAVSPSVFETSSEPGVYVYATGEAGTIRIPTSPAGVFDPVAWARSLAQLIVAEILDGDRATRLVALHARDPQNPSLVEVLDRSVRATWGAAPRSEPRLAPLQRVAQRAVLDRIIAMSQDEKAAPEVRGAAIVTLTDLLAQLRSATPADPESRGHIALAVRDVRQVLERTK